MRRGWSGGWRGRGESIRWGGCRFLEKARGVRSGDDGDGGGGDERV